jgi:transcription initiation factor IIE alpha subunit
MSNAVVLVETLVSTVARAFYTDTVVVLLEGLMHEKYIIEEELGPRMKLTAKDVRKITTQLESEMLIKFESVTIDETKSVLKCYYIDYQQFVDVVRFRVHLMQRELVSEEKTELNEVYYQCPTCKNKYSSLEVQRLLSADYKFICNSCCPATNFRAAVSEPYYRLIEVDNSGKLSTLQLLERKLEEQMNKSKLHDGIFDLLGQLRDVPVGRNLPSQNISKGVRSSKITDERVVQEIKQNFEYATGQFGSSLIKKKTQETIANGLQPSDGAGGFTINIESASEAALKHQEQQQYDDYGTLHTTAVGSEGAGRLHTNDAELKKSLPFFLRDSRVEGAQEMLRSVKSLQQTAAEERQRQEEGDHPTKRARTEAGAAESKEGPDDGAGDDVAWEDGNEDDEDVAWEDGGDADDGDEVETGDQ